MTASIIGLTIYLDVASITSSLIILGIGGISCYLDLTLEKKLAKLALVYGIHQYNANRNNIIDTIGNVTPDIFSKNHPIIMKNAFDKMLPNRINPLLLDPGSIFKQIIDANIIRHTPLRMKTNIINI